MKLNSLFLTPLGAAAPIGVNKKSEAVTAMAVAAGVASLLGSLISAGSQESANASNLKGVRETNEANAAINKSQLEFARQQYFLERDENRFLVGQQHQWDLENRDYNSPQQLVARLRAAGINPALALTGGGASVGSSQLNSSTGQNAHGNVPNMLSMQAPHRNPVDYSGLGVSANTMAQLHLSAERNQADITAMKQHTDNETLETLAKIRNYDWNNQYLKAQMNMVLDDIRFNRENWNVRSDALKLANSKIEKDMMYQQSMTEYQNIVNSFEVKNREQILENLAAEYDNIMSQVYEHNENGALAAANKALVGVEKSTKEKMAEWIVDDAYNKANESYWRSEKAGRNFLLGDDLGRTPAVDYFDGGKSYSSPNAQFRGYKNRSNPYKRYSRRTDLDHVR